MTPRAGVRANLHTGKIQQGKRHIKVEGMRGPGKSIAATAADCTKKHTAAAPGAAEGALKAAGEHLPVKEIKARGGQIRGRLGPKRRLHTLHKRFIKNKKNLKNPVRHHIIEIEIEHARNRQEAQSMNALTINNTAVIPANDLPPVLFEDFIAFIDRGEKTTRTYITNLRQFAAWLKYNAIRRPVRQDIISYRDYLTTEHDAIQLDDSATGWTYRTDGSGNRYTVKCRPNTVKLYLQSVRQFFSWTAAAGYYPNIAANVHAPKVRQDAHKKDALTAADVLSIEKSIAARAEARTAAAAAAEKDTAGRISRTTEQGKRLFAIYTLAVNAGLRTIEISRANVKDLEMKNGNACLYVFGKGHTEADTKKPLAPEVYAAIRDYLDSRSDKPTANSPLFVATGNRSGGKRLAPTTISTMLKRAMQEAGFNSEKITAHSLRHSAGTATQEITGNLFLTQKYMRHANPATTEIYLHNDTDRQEADIAQKLYNFYHGTADQGAKLESILQGMTAAQLEQLTSIAATLAR